MDTNSSSLLIFLRKKMLLYAVYVFSAILNSLCMILAVLIGATGGLVPIDSMWFKILPFPTKVFYLANALFITFLPLFVAVNLNLILIRYAVKRKGHLPLGNLSRLIFGVILAFPLLYIAVAFYLSFSFILGWPEVVIAWSGIAAGFLVLYQFCVSTVMTNNPKQYFLDCISNPVFWFIVFLFTGILLFPSAMLVTPLHKGYFRYFPTYEVFLLTLPDLVVRASVIGVLLLLAQYGFLNFAIRLERKTENQKKQKHNEESHTQ